MDGDGWMKMLEGRNLTSHTYDEATAIAMVAEIRKLYAPLFKDLVAKLESFRKGKQGELF